MSFPAYWERHLLLSLRHTLHGPSATCNHPKPLEHQLYLAHVTQIVLWETDVMRRSIQPPGVQESSPDPSLNKSSQLVCTSISRRTSHTFPTCCEPGPPAARSFHHERLLEASKHMLEVGGVECCVALGGHLLIHECIE